MRSVFLTAASGVLGSVIAQAFQSAGWQVSGISRSPEGVAALRARGIEAALGGVMAPDVLAAQAERTECIVHTALYHDIADPITLAADRCVQRTLYGTATRTGARVLLAQDIRIFGAGVVPESAPSPPPYCLGAERSDGKIACGTWHLLRLPVFLFGPHSHRGIAPFLELARLRGVVFCPHTSFGTLAWATLNEAASCFLEVATAGHPPPISAIQSGPPLSLRTMAEMVAEAVGLPLHFLSEPECRALGPAGEAILAPALCFADRPPSTADPKQSLVTALAEFTI